MQSLARSDKVSKTKGMSVFLILIFMIITLFGCAPADQLQACEDADSLMVEQGGVDCVATQEEVNCTTNQEILYKDYLKIFVSNYNLSNVVGKKNEFLYYYLYDNARELQGFVFLAEEEGWAGPIKLFIKTNLQGEIQEVYVWHHTETPVYVIGIDDFLASFVGHKIDASLTWQQDVHGITGATVTAESIIKAIFNQGIRASEEDLFSAQ